MRSHVSYLFIEIKMLTKSSDNGHCWCSFSRFSKPILRTHLKLKILQIDDLFKFEVTKFVYDSLHNKIPIHFANISVKLLIAQVEQYETVD